MAKDVLCSVHNCQYWEQGNQCSAEQIFVISHTGEQADHQIETDCNTFKPADMHLSHLRL